MLDSIKDFLLDLIDPFVSVFDFIISFVSDLVYIIKLVGSLVLNIPDYLSWLPSAILTLIVGIFAIVVIYKVLGREG